jgi:hypothetical protein
MPTIAYLTDVEGKWSKLASFAERNPYVSLDADGRLTVAEDALFVFGGDAVDRGPEARRVVATLLDVKRRQPDRVVLLAGNRDINKLRLVRELDGHPPARAPEDVRSGPRGALLRWIFTNTMGAPEAFEHRRTELSRAGEASTDDAVVESFLLDLRPGGVLRDYLAACQLAFVGERTLFVHGGVTPESFGAVPGHAARELDPLAWEAGLNAFYSAQMSAFLEGAMLRDTPGWAPLVAYQAPVPGTRANQASVVYARPTDTRGNPVLPPRAVIEALGSAGITRVVVGHTPSGDCPAVLRDGEFELVLADNSYGRTEPGSRVFLARDEARIEGSTVLDGGEGAGVAFTTRRHDAATPLGLRDGDTGRLVKAQLDRGDYLLFRGLDGYRVEQVAVPADALAGARLVPPRT